MNDGIEHWTDLASSGWLANEEKSMKKELWVYETVGDTLGEYDHSKYMGHHGIPVRNRDTDIGQQGFQTKWALDEEEYALFREVMALMGTTEITLEELNKNNNEESCDFTTRIQRRR